MSEQLAMPATGSDASASSSTWTAELKASFALAWPLIVAQLAQNLLFTTDVVLMGWLGPKYLAAGTLAGAWLMPFQLTGIGIVGAVAPLVAQARGRRDIKAVRRTVRQGFWVAILVATILVPIVLAMQPAYLALGQDPEVVALAQSYMLYGFWMLYPALGIMVLRSFLSAFSVTRIILLVTVLGVTVNAVLAYTLIFGHFGFPRLELRGAAIATGLVNLVMFGALLAYALTHKRLKRFHILIRFLKPDWPRFAEILKVGLPIGLTVAAEVGLFSVAAMLMGRLGTNETAAHAVALQLAATAFMVPLGLGMAATVRVGLAYGRGDHEGVRKAAWTAVMLGVGFMTFTASLFLTIPHTLVAIFLDSTDPANADALALAAAYLAIAGLFQLADGAQVVAAHSLRGLSDTRTPSLLAIFGYWFVGLPVAYTLGFVLDLRGTGIWLGLATGLAFVAVLLLSRFAMRERLGLLKGSNDVTELKAAEQRVADALENHALPGKVIVLEQLATTAQMAADALGIEVGRIVKSLMFKGKDSGKPYLLLVSGANRVHEKRAGRQIGEVLERSDADFVKQWTGFSIGGVSPFGHPAPLATYLDRDLFQYGTVWAAAGDPRSVFEITAADLERTTGAIKIDVT